MVWLSDGNPEQRPFARGLALDSEFITYAALAEAGAVRCLRLNALVRIRVAGHLRMGNCLNEF